jgi:hypothetical protein
MNMHAYSGCGVSNVLDFCNTCDNEWSASCFGLFTANIPFIGGWRISRVDTGRDDEEKISLSYWLSIVIHSRKEKICTFLGHLVPLEWMRIERRMCGFAYKGYCEKLQLLHDNFQCTFMITYDSTAENLLMTGYGLDYRGVEFESR